MLDDKRQKIVTEEGHWVYDYSCAKASPWSIRNPKVWNLWDPQGRYVGNFATEASLRDWVFHRRTAAPNQLT